MKAVREQVLDLLIDVEKEKAYAQLSLKTGLQDMDQRDKALATEIFYGTLKYQIQLDYFINQYSKTPIKKMKPLIRQLLRMSVYQMLYLDKIPVSAVINEAVKITKKRKMQGLSGFVNGVLRKMDREREQLLPPSKEQGNIKHLSIQYALPEWIIEMWLESYEEPEVEKICKALNERAEVCGRWNTLKLPLEEKEKVLTKEHITFEPGRLLEEAFYLKKVEGISNAASFKSGEWTVQDESAMLVAHVVDPKPKQKVLDMCSAPGGKSMHMAALMQNEGSIIACDVHPHKLELIQKNANRLGVTIVKPTLQNGTVFNPEWEGQFDKVLLDAPCSGLGIMKRKPDIRLNKTRADLEAIASIQEALFENAVRYLKEDGELVYSTCTISKLENEEMVQKMITTHRLEQLSIAYTIPKVLHESIEEEGMIQILPYVVDTDGFFIAKLRKRSNI